MHIMEEKKYIYVTHGYGLDAHINRKGLTKLKGRPATCVIVGLPVNTVILGEPERIDVYKKWGLVRTTFKKGRIQRQPVT